MSKRHFSDILLSEGAIWGLIEFWRTTGEGSTLGVNESRDVSSAALYLKRSRGFLQIVAVGVSQGAASAIIAAGKDPNIDGVIADSSFRDYNDLVDPAARLLGLPHWLTTLTIKMFFWRIGIHDMSTPLDAVARISPRPILFIHGTRDESFPFQASQALFDRTGEPKSLWLVPNSKHGAASYEHPEEYKQHVTGFLHTYFALDKAAHE